ncbi:putative homing endonuclease [Vibrio phage phiKT1024]|nr:putative homing endonuclease [Vibrio phage phiKT1024]
MSVDERVVGKTAHHHILPKSKNLPFTKYQDLKKFPWNGVYLTHSDHYRAHYLLTLSIDNYFIQYAFQAMHNKNINSGIIEEYDIISENEYQQSMEKFSLMMSNRQNEVLECGKTRAQLNAQKQWVTKRKRGNIGDASQMHTQESRTKRYETMSKVEENGLTQLQNGALHMVEKRGDITGENNPFFGKKHTEETRQRMRDAKEGFVPWNKGKTMPEHTREKLRKPKSDEAKQNMRAAKLGKKQRTTSCAICGREISVSSIKRHETACKKSLTKA